MIPSMYEIQEIFFNEDKCIEYLINKNILKSDRSCPHCKIPMRIKVHEGRFRCPTKSCRKAISIRKDSFFENHKLHCSKILFMSYLWLSKVPTKSIIKMTGCSSDTICSLQHQFRSLLTESLTIENTIIGGEGIIVEIDESKIGKRKHNRGHHVDGAWIVGGIERTDEKKIFLVEVTDRSSKTLIDIIIKHVRPGTIIYTDMWKGYNKISENDYIHNCVNHSISFKDPETGIHTNTIEGLWNGLKIQIKPRNRTKTNVNEYIMEFIWRRNYKHSIWESFLSTLA